MKTGWITVVIKVLANAVLWVRDRIRRTRESEKVCGSCKWWCGWRKSEYGEGTCRRRAPVFWNSDGINSAHRYPEVGKNDWCGEWEKAKEEE